MAELSQAVDGELKLPKNAPLYKDKVKVKGAIADGQEIPFDAALKMPTRQQAIGAVLAALLSPAAAILGGLVGAGGQVAGQIQKISEKAPEAAEAAPAAGKRRAGRGLRRFRTSPRRASERIRSRSRLARW